MQRRIPIVLAVALAALPLSACGQNKTERGLVTTPEVATPESPKDLKESEQQREKQQVQQEEKAEDKAFDASDKSN